ncbi:hypothetical protein [Chamaesiphon sp. OTE_8_metabat_110]|uniref:hypothetical protein n=1 Tax=Chamaesiphon sp. OTE_8_metabat_110 TaxID=2964696 RepID=UPI00286C96CB|nr:hypothetical protein [Chamaesiphon sp. OTE_8_metabat_110]
MPQPSVKSIWLELHIDPNDPELLATLDFMVRSRLLDRSQILQLARECLSETLPVADLPAYIPATNVEPLTPRAPSRVQYLWQHLKDELSVRWLLFLGVFLVVLSSGVLAATQWSLFPAWGQYGLLWLYTIGFWVVGAWARRQEGLRLTANTLQIVTLLLIPVNFWAIDSFGLWQQPLELVTALLAGCGLAGILYLRYRKERDKANFQHSGWLLATYLVLSCLHLGWQIPSWSAIAIYIGAIGVVILLQKLRQIEGGSLAIYGLGMLLLRGLFVEHLPIYSFGLAIGIVGWLFTQWGLQKSYRLTRLQSRKVDGNSLRVLRFESALGELARLYQQIGASLLGLGWLLGIGDLISIPKNSSWQAVAVSILALIWILQRLRAYQQQQSVVSLFFVGLQTYLISNFLWTPLATGAILAKILPFLLLLFGQNYLLAGSLLIFPYLLLWVWLTDWFWQQGWHSLSRRGEALILWTGAILPLINLTTPLSLLIDLVASTAILAHLTLRYLPIRTSYIYFTHLCGLATIFAALTNRWDWCRSIARNFVGVSSRNNDDVLDFTVLAIVLSILTVTELWLATQPVTRARDGWYRSSWRIGGGLTIATGACYLTLATFPAQQTIWPIWWSLVPIAFTYVATRKPPLQPWQLATQTQSAWYAIAGLGGSLLLTVDRPQWRSILLAIAIGVMFPLVQRLKQILPAAIQIGFGIGLGVNLLVAFSFPTHYWLVIGAIACGGLWVVSRKLPRIYAVAADRWAIAIAGLGLATGSLNYLRTDLNWFAEIIEVFSNSPGLFGLQSGTVTRSGQVFDNIHATTFLAAGILIAAIQFRQRWQSTIPAAVWFWSTIWTSEIALSALVHLLGGDTLVLATVNILLALPLWLRTRHQPEPEFQLAPLLLASWGLLLRLPFFETYTGLLTISVGIVAVLVSRRLSPIVGYGGLLLVTGGCYELVTHYLLQTPPGGNIADAFTIYGLVTAILALGYRLSVWWRSRQDPERWGNFTLAGLRNFAHLHWAVASAWKVAAASIPTDSVPPKLTLVHLGISILLGGYALIQARATQHEGISHRDRADWWIYLGLAELMGVGIYARSIFQRLGILDEGLILISCLLGLLILLAPWRQWGWRDRPWRLIALLLPLSRVIFEFVGVASPVENRISLLNLAVLAVFYAGVARRQRQFGWAYLSAIFLNWAAFRLLFAYNLTSPLWYATAIGLSILAAVQWDPYWQTSKQNRHYGRILGSSIIAVTALLWHQPWLPIGIGLAIASIGILVRVRAWLYVGTIAFLLTNTYQLLILITEYPITKWAIGLLAGVLIITLAANFERRKEQIKRALQRWLDRFQVWE